ncbi:PINIT domain-containing protein [Sphaerosporella brunnea]|uniref:PINIT domain-containing protein n=1 Tax=Sphaerosporella brunnea TaxID=1250544 RepID=A0A5J5F405_9PEZI|nr:PINIT domain-containing protein [Sphaerosporella brunnea]
MATITKDEAASLMRYVNSHLIVRQLQHVLKNEGQPASGLKAPLQRRLITHIEDIVKRNDVSAFQRVKNLVYRPDGGQSPPARTVPGYPTGTNAFSSSVPAGRTSQAPIFAGASTFTLGANIPRIFFKESPFYTLLTTMSDYGRCPIMQQHRNTVSVTVTLTEAQVLQMKNDKSHRCMVYCAAMEPVMGFTRDTNVAFPHQVEVRVNDLAVSGLNLRGLKNKPGSTRPADITDKLKMVPNYRNEISLTYAVTQKEFVFMVNYIKTETVENLVKRLYSGSSISKEEVITDLVRKNGDSDLVATSTIMSLKCPLSTLRIELPVRSIFCKHVQCFDATSFLQLQLQAPTWTCPTCSQSISFKQLVIDRYFEDILNSTPKNVESVTIDSDGKWSVAVESSNSPVPDDSDDEDFKSKTQVVDLDDDDDSTLMPSFLTAALHPKEDTVTRGSNGTNKRPASNVIDLTLSDDDEPPRPTKRHNVLPTPSSVGSGFSPSDSVTQNEHSPVRAPSDQYSNRLPGWYD